MSELFEQQAPSFLEAGVQTQCSTVEHPLIAAPLQPVAFAMFGCAIGMIAMGAVCASIMRGWTTRRFEALDREVLEPDELDGAEPETRR